MRTLQYLITAAIATTIAFSSCKKEAESPQEPDQEANFSRETGAPIIFGASSVYDNATKVEYSGEVYEGKERIDWGIKDKIMIFCQEAANNKDADYEVAGAPTPFGFKSMASIEKAERDEMSFGGRIWGENPALQWGDENTHIFYATHPHISLDSPWHYIYFTETGIRTLAKVASQTPLMTGFAIATKDGSSPVTLNFSPAVTTFDIELKNNLSPIELHSVSLISFSNYINGDFYINISKTGERVFEFDQTELGETDYGYVSASFYPRKILNHNEKIQVRLNTRPEDIEKLSLQIVGKRADDDTEKTWTLDLKENGEWKRFEKLKKHNLRNIQIPASDDFNNKLELNPNSSNLDFAPGGGQPIVHPVEVKSYTENKDGTKVYPLPWGIFYLYNDAWIDKDMSQLIYPAAPDNGFTKMNLFMKETAPLNQDYVQRLNAMKALPAKNDCDLSLFGTTRYTANCYIVNSKGTYKFPLAYGNACKSDGTNDESFTCMHSGENLQLFENGAGEPIGTPFFTANKVELVWEDSPGLIETLSLGRPGEDPEDNRLQFVHFSIGEKIDFGNAIIAVKNENNVTIWTWHIWVIDINQEDIFNFPDKQLFNYPLGYRHKKWDYSEPAFYEMKVKQLDVLDAKEKFFEVTKMAGTGYASCLYYTYGRLTPLMPTKRMYFEESWTENPETTVMIEDCYTASFDQNGVRGKTRIVPLKNATGRKTLSEAINIPAEICLLSKSYNNLWNNRRTASTNTEVGVFIKTVYDPCPVGLMVPSTAYYEADVNEAARWEDWKMGAYTNRVENTYPEKYDHTVKNFSECVYFHTSDTPFKNAAGGVLSTDPKIRHLPILPIRGE